MDTESSISSRTCPQRPGATSPWVSSETILRAIFDHYLDGPSVLPHNKDADPRYSFMLVCKTWKDIITTTPNYWNRLIFNPVQLKSTKRQLSIYHSYIKRSKQAQLSLLFATAPAPDDIRRKPIVTFLPKKVLKGHSVLELLYGHAEVNVIESMIIPYAGRIYELHCIIANYAAHQSLSTIGPGVFSTLRFLHMSFVNGGSPSESRSDLEAGYLFDLKAFTDLPVLYIAHIHITNGVHPLDLKLPWHQLTNLDFFDTSIPARTLLRILHRCSVSLKEGYFTTDLDALTKIYTRPFSVHMKSLTRFRLRILHGEYDDHFERVLILPVLEHIWIEKTVGFVMHKWDLEHYTSVLSPSSATLTQLVFSNNCIPSIHSKRENPVHRTSYHYLSNLFQALPNITFLQLPSGIHIHPPTLERIACGELLPRLTTFEVSTLLPDVIFSVLQKRNGIESGPSNQRLRYSSITHVQMNLPVCPRTKQEEITKYGNEIDLGISRASKNGLNLKFVAQCQCWYCFGS